MGIIRSDTIDTRYGDSIANSYTAIANESIIVERQDDEDGGAPEFHVNFTARVWISQDARNAGKVHVAVQTYRKTFAEMPGSNIYTIAYDHIKSTLAEGTYTDA